MNLIPTKHFLKRFKKRFPNHDVWREVEEAVNNPISVPPGLFKRLMRGESNVFFLCNPRKILFIVKNDRLITCYSIKKKNVLFELNEFDNL